MASTMIASQITHIPGILLNPTHRRFSTPPQSLSHTTSIHYILASSASSTSSSSASLKLNLSDRASTPSGRKIRFAPLPDPRKLEEEEDDASETSLSDEAPNAPDPGSNKPLSLTRSTSEDAYDNTISSYSNGSNMALSNSPSKPSTWKFFKPLLPNKKKQDLKDPYALFRATSSESIHSTQSLYSCPARSSRRCSISSSTVDAGSTASINSQERAAILSHTTPLTHSVSEGGGPAGRRPHTSLGPQSRSGRRLPRPQLMLNGRVYGRKRAAVKVNPFQNQRAFEPEFSEWGSGGLGSVPSNRASGAAADWDRLHNTKSIAKAHDDDDDGSGMVWVKKRREEREQAARERANQERLAAEAAAAPKEDSNGDAEQITVATPGEQDREISAESISAVGIESGAAGDSNAKTISPPSSSPTPQVPASTSPTSSHVPLARTPSATTQALSLEHNTSVQVLPPPPHIHALHNHQKKHSASSLNYRLNISRVSSNDSGTIRGVPSGQVTPIASASRELFPKIKEGVNGEEASEESNDEDDEDDDDDEEDEVDLEVRCSIKFLMFVIHAEKCCVYWCCIGGTCSEDGSVCGCREDLEASRVSGSIIPLTLTFRLRRSLLATCLCP